MAEKTTDHAVDQPLRDRIADLVPWFLLAAAVGPLGVAYIAEYGFGYEPCVLCLYQRIPYGIVLGLGIVALFVTAPRPTRLIAFLAGAVFAAGAGLAFHHVGVEQQWWTSAAPCGASGGAVTSTEQLFAALENRTEKACDEIDWTLFGISMATYNVAFSLGLAAVSFWAWRRMGRMGSQ